MDSSKMSSYHDFFYEYNSTNSSEFHCSIVQAAIADISVERLRDDFIYFYSPALVFLGIVGNSLLVTVFLSTKLKNISSSFYLAGLGISDSLILLDLAIEWIRFFGINIYGRNYFCQLLTFINRTAHFLSVWLVVAFSVERFIVVVFSRRQTIRNTRQGCFIAIGVFMSGCLTRLPYLVLFAPCYQEDDKIFVCDVMGKFKVSILDIIKR